MNAETEAAASVRAAETGNGKARATNRARSRNAPNGAAMNPAGRAKIAARVRRTPPRPAHNRRKCKISRRTAKRDKAVETTIPA